MKRFSNLLLVVSFILSSNCAFAQSKPGLPGISQATTPQTGRHPALGTWSTDPNNDLNIVEIYVKPNLKSGVFITGDKASHPLEISKNGNELIAFSDLGTFSIEVVGGKLIVTQGNIEILEATKKQPTTSFTNPQPENTQPQTNSNSGAGTAPLAPSNTNSNGTTVTAPKPGTNNGPQNFGNSNNAPKQPTNPNAGTVEAPKAAPENSNSAGPGSFGGNKPAGVQPQVQPVLPQAQPAQQPQVQPANQPLDQPAPPRPQPQSPTGTTNSPMSAPGGSFGIMPGNPGSTTFFDPPMNGLPTPQYNPQPLPSYPQAPDENTGTTSSSTSTGGSTVQIEAPKPASPQQPSFMGNSGTTKPTNSGINNFAPQNPKPNSGLGNPGGTQNPKPAPPIGGVYNGPPPSIPQPSGPSGPEQIDIRNPITKPGIPPAGGVAIGGAAGAAGGIINAAPPQPAPIGSGGIGKVETGLGATYARGVNIPAGKVDPLTGEIINSPNNKNEVGKTKKGTNMQSNR